MRSIALPIAFAVAVSLPAQQAPPPAARPAPSTLLRPGLEALGSGLDPIRIDRWKLPPAARDEASSNLASIHRDLESTLPALLLAADAAPASLAAALPVSRNITALYDVLLRLTERAKGTAPADQLATLDHARAALDSARRAFDESLQSNAAAQELLLRQLQAPPLAPPPPPPPPPAKKKKGR